MPHSGSYLKYVLWIALHAGTVTLGKKWLDKCARPMTSCQNLVVQKGLPGPNLSSETGSVQSNFGLDRSITDCSPQRAYYLCSVISTAENHVEGKIR
jgi:hypothetical protein